MIVSFGHHLAANLFEDRRSKEVRRFPVELHQIGRRKLPYLQDPAALGDFGVPPGNRLERLRGERAGYYSIRINDQWRVVFRWEAGNALDVQVVDYRG